MSSSNSTRRLEPQASVRSVRFRHPVGEQAAARHLCTACGMCCDGTLFSYVPLTTADRVQPKPADRVLLEDGQAGLKQACPFHRNGLCTIYHSGRPQNCVRFRCEQLKRYAGAEITLVQALAETESVKCRVDAIRSRLRATAGTHARSLAELFAKWLAVQGGCYADWTGEQETLLQDYGLLLAHLRRTHGASHAAK